MEQIDKQNNKIKTMAKKTKQVEETQVQEPQLKPERINWYEFDWDNKITSLEDIKVIFKSLRMTVSDKAEDFETLKKYIKDEVAYQTN
jgi:hypothetical protein